MVNLCVGQKEAQAQGLVAQNLLAVLPIRGSRRTEGADDLVAAGLHPDPLLGSTGEHLGQRRTLAAPTTEDDQYSSLAASAHSETVTQVFQSFGSPAIRFSHRRNHFLHGQIGR